MEQFEHRDISGVPCLVLQPQQTPVGQVVLYHGWGSTAESYKFFASLLFHWGYRVIVPELPHHGVRGSLNYADPAALQTHFWSIVSQGVHEAAQIVADLSSDPLPITMIGHSTGGFITAGTFAKHPQISSAVVINGSCAWVHFEEMYRKAIGFPPMPDQDKQAMEQIDPLTYIPHMNPSRPLLLLHCQDDTTVPVDGQRYFMEVVKNTGRTMDHIQLIEFPKVNHQITMGMLQKIKEFLDAQRE